MSQTKPSPTEQRYVDLITKNPGLAAPQIAAKIGANVSQASVRLSVLSKHGFIARKLNLSGKGFTYWPKAAIVAQAEPAATTAQNTDVGKERAVGQDDISTIVDNVARLIAEKLAARAISYILPTMEERLRSELQVMTDSLLDTAKAAVRKPAEQKPKLVSVFIGGALPDQTTKLRKEFEGVADLRFATSDESLHKWKSMCTGADHTVLMVDFISHKHTEAVESVGVRPIKVSGGVSSVINKVMELCLK